MAVEPTEVAQLPLELRRMHTTVVHWSLGRWSARIADGRSRGDALFALVLDLAELAARAGGSAPTEARPPRLGNHSLPDQLAVVGAGLLDAPDVEHAAPDALAAVAATRLLLLG